MYWIQLNSIHQFGPYYISQNVLVTAFLQRISQFPLLTCPQLEEITFYSEPSEHFIYTLLITFFLNYRYLWRELNYSTGNLFLYFPHPTSKPWIWQFLGSYMWMDDWVNKGIQSTRLPNVFLSLSAALRIMGFGWGGGGENIITMGDNGEDEDKHSK